MREKAIELRKLPDDAQTEFTCEICGRPMGVMTAKAWRDQNGAHSECLEEERKENNPAAGKTPQRAGKHPRSKGAKSKA